MVSASEDYKLERLAFLLYDAQERLDWGAGADDDPNMGELAMGALNASAWLTMPDESLQVITVPLEPRLTKRYWRDLARLLASHVRLVEGERLDG